MPVTPFTFRTWSSNRSTFCERIGPLSVIRLVSAVTSMERGPESPIWI